MSSEDYRARRAALTSQLEDLERAAAPPEHRAAALANLVVLDLDFEEPAAARTALAGLDSLRKQSAETESVYYVSASRLASAEQDGGRAVWLAEHAVVVARRQVPTYLPHALLQLSDALLAAGRDDESGWARAEAVTRFEDGGDFGYAAAALLSWTPRAEDEAARFLRAVALAEQSGATDLVAWALRRLAGWHADRQHYLPARHALDRALKLERDAEDDGRVETLLALSSIEAEAFHNEDAVRFADEALAAARAPHERGQALRARAEGLGQLHRHAEARAALLEARRAFDEAGWDEWAWEARNRSITERVLVLLHRLPRWLFEPGDMSTREANRAHPPRFGRLLALVAFLAVAGWLGWAELCAVALERVESRPAQLGLLALGCLPGLVALWAWLLVVWSRWRDARQRRRALRDKQS